MIEREHTNHQYEQRAGLNNRAKRPKKTYASTNYRDCPIALAVPTFLFLLLLLVLPPKTSKAQLQLNSNVTAQQLAQAIVGNGCMVTNAALVCPDTAKAIFTNVSSNIGLQNGILLTNGAASIANGPNNLPNAGYNDGAPGDFDLTTLSGTATYDACSLEFDIIPSCDTIRITYVFGSEEYLVYVNRKFNDVFAFYISGPGYTGLQNIAVVPGTALPVCINNINPGNNPQYYIDNSAGTTIQYNGFTTPLVAVAAVTPCVKYHIKLAISDVLDGIFDSGVFIQGNSIRCAPQAYTNLATNTNAIKSCSNGSFTFCRTGDSTLAYTVSYTVGGTAVSGVDYTPLSGSAVIPALQSCVTTNVVTLPNNAGGSKSVQIIYQHGLCPLTDTINLQIVDPGPLDAGPNVSICSGDSVALGNTPALLTNYTWTPVTGLSNPNIFNPKLSLINNGTTDLVYTYVVTASKPTMATCILTDSLQVTVHPLPTSKFGVQAVSCVGDRISFVDQSTSPATGGITTWYWNFGNNLFDIVQNPVIKYNIAGTFTVNLTVTDHDGCKDDTAEVILVSPLPLPNFTSTAACQGDSVKFVNTSSVPGAGTILQCIWNFGDGSPLISNLAPFHLYPQSSNTYTVQLIVTSAANCVSTTQEVINLNPNPIASFTTTPLSACLYDPVKFDNTSNGNNNNWSFGDGTMSTNRNALHQYLAPGIYSVQLITSNNFGCSDTALASVVVHPVPKFDFTASDTAGCPSFCTQFQARPLPGSDSVASWSWLFNSGQTGSGASAKTCYTGGGRYTPRLIGTSNYGCVDTLVKTAYIHVYPSPVPAFSENTGVITVYQPTVQVTNASSADVVKWWWTFGDTKTDSGAGPISHTYLENIDSSQYTIWLHVTNIFGCSDSVYHLVQLRTESALFIPNTFTPNGDGINEVFRPFGCGIYQTAGFEMNIFDRWGMLILTTNDIITGWDGTFRGNKCQQDVYVYEVFFTNPADGTLLTLLRGHVNLIR